MSTSSSHGCMQIFNRFMKARLETQGQNSHGNLVRLFTSLIASLHLHSSLPFSRRNLTRAVGNLTRCSNPMLCCLVSCPCQAIPPLHWMTATCRTASRPLCVTTNLPLARASWCRDSKMPMTLCIRQGCRLARCCQHPDEKQLSEACAFEI